MDEFSDDDSDFSNDRSWNEDDCIDVDEIKYDSPFDHILGSKEFKN